MVLYIEILPCKTQGPVYPMCFKNMAAARSQGISSHDIDLVLLEYSIPGTRWFKQHRKYIILLHELIGPWEIAI